jgi:hypothetical protein
MLGKIVYENFGPGQRMFVSRDLQNCIVKYCLQIISCVWDVSVVIKCA